MAEAIAEGRAAAAASVVDSQVADAELLDDSMSQVDHFAAVIQSHWRGYQVRKTVKNELRAPIEGLQVLSAANLQQMQLPLQQQQALGHLQVTSDVYKPVTGTVVRNRGLLRAAAQSRRQHLRQPQQHHVHSWKQFASRQARRYVPAPTRASRRAVSESACHRLRIQSVSNLPPMNQVPNGVTYELQLGVSLFDEASRTFYGNTCYSPSGALEQQQHTAVTTVGMGVEVNFDVYFHSMISDPQCMAVVEVIMVEKNVAGVATGHFSIGWAQLPLFVHNASSSRMPGSTAAAAPMMSGTPRYLLLRSVCGNGLQPPTVIQDCHITYQAALYPPMDPAKPLLPPDFLVSYTDIVPGLRRIDCTGQVITSHKSSNNTLVSSILAPVLQVRLDKLQLQMPQVLHNLISVLSQLLGIIPPPDLPALLAVPPQPLAVRYTLLVGVHNGRTFVGPQLAIQQLQVQPAVGSVVLQPQEGVQSLQLEALLVDDLVVLVLELLAEPAVEQAADASAGPLLIGRVAMSPFKHPLIEGTTEVLTTDLQKLSFDCNSINSCSSAVDCPLDLLGGMTQSMLPVNWRALLGDTAVRSIPAPAVQFQLVAAGMASSLPTATGETLAAFAPCMIADATTTPAEQQQQQPVVVLQPPVAVSQQTQQAEAQVVQHSKSIIADVARLPGETRASMAIRQAAKDLEEAASIPSLEPSEDQAPDTMQPHRQSDRDVSANGMAQQNQQQQQLTDTMQQQISALARAVEELKEERQTLRSSLTALESTVTAHAAAAPTDSQSAPGSSGIAAAAAAWSAADSRSRPHGTTSFHQEATGSLSAAELEHLKGLQPTAAGVAARSTSAGRSTALSNAQAAAAAQTNSPRTSQQHSLFMTANIGQAASMDMQTSPHGARAALGLSPMAMDVEGRDMRTASDIVLQLLAFKPTTAPDAATQLPPALRSIYFTLHFYKFGPMVTEQCLLAVDDDTASGMGERQQTLMLVPSKQQQHNGAGFLLKYKVDGSNPGQLLPGQDPQQAAYECHMTFCSYLATHKLALEIWDGDSLLQLGQCSVNLQGLLRQGRESSEVVIEAPVLQPDNSGQQFADAPEQRDLFAHQPVQLGLMVLRLINIGREPSNAAARTPDFDAVQPEAKTAGKKVRVRAVPLEPSSPVAKELRGRTTTNSSPFRIDWQQQQASGPDRLLQVQSPSKDAFTAASDIISFEQRKVARAHQLQQLLSKSSAKGVPGSPTYNAFMQPATPQNSPIRRPGSPMVLAGAGSPAARGQHDPYKAVQRQLLADVDAVRKRQKAGFIRSQLRKDLVTSVVIQPSPGETLLLEHMLHNPMGRDTVFEVKVSHIDELSAVHNMQEYRQLQQAVGPATQTSATALSRGVAAAGQIPTMSALARAVNNNASTQQFVSKGRIFLAANERISIPMRYRLSAVDSDVVEQDRQQHTVMVEFMPLELGYPVNTLELQVQHQPVIVDRTLHYHTPEQDTLRAVIPLQVSTSSASCAVLAAAAAGTLTAAASRTDVSVHVASATGTATSSSSDPTAAVALRFKCAHAPEVVQFLVWLYGDGCMAKPLETWQVNVHALQKIDMRAVVGQVSSTSLAVAAGTAGQRQVVCYSSNLAELQPTPAVLELPVLGIAALNLTFKPLRAGKQWVRVNLVDSSSKQVIHALLVATEATLPPISTSFEIELPAGTVVRRQIMYKNPCAQSARIIECFKFVSNSPWLLSFQPDVLELAPRGSKPLTLVVDSRALKAGSAVQVLMFVQDALGRQEECLQLLVRCL